MPGTYDAIKTNDSLHGPTELKQVSRTGQHASLNGHADASNDRLHGDKSHPMGRREPKGGGNDHG